MLLIICSVSPQLMGQATFTIKDSVSVTDAGGVVVLSDGSFYVTERATEKIKKYDKNGTFISEFGGAGTTDGLFDNPTGIAIDSQGNIFVVDRDNNRVQKFNSSGTFIKVIGTTTASTANGDFDTPIDIAIDAADNIYVVDAVNDRVQKLTNDGVFIKNIGSTGAGDGQFEKPFGIATDSDANIYVTDADNDNVQKFDSTGTFISKFGTFGSGNGEFQGPTDIAFDANGNIYVVDVTNDNIQIFNSSFTYVRDVNLHRNLVLPTFMAFNSNGEFFVTDKNLDYVYIYTPVQEINVKAGTANIPSSSTRDFGNVNTGSSTSDVTFTIENLGGVDLTLSGTAGSLVALSGTDASDFTVTQTNVTSSIAEESNVTFTVAFSPSSAGTKSATLTIMSNDADEGTYTINLTGKGVTPEINVKAAGADVASGGNYDFGSVQSGQSSSDVTFTIENTGDGALALTGTAGSLVVLSGTNAADFTVTQTNVTSPVAAGGNVTFTVKYTASTSAIGAASAVLTITSDDADESTYTINLAGSSTSSVTGLPANLISGSLKVGPIPAHDHLNVAISGAVSPKVQYQIIDLQGRLVSKGSATTQNGKVSLNVESLKDGTYLFVVQTAQGTVVRRIQKQ